MDELVVSTDVYAPPEDAYEFLLDFPGYRKYTKYLDRVSRTHGDGGPGSRYAMRFRWWKVTYTARSTVTDVDPPNRIDWRIVKDLDAHGAWEIQPHDDRPTDAPDDVTDACTVTLRVRFDPDTASSDALSLPGLVSLDWVIDRAKDLVQEEAERVVRRAVADLEGRERDVTLRVNADSEAL